MTARAAGTFPQDPPRTGTPPFWGGFPFSVPRVAWLSSAQPRQTHIQRLRGHERAALQPLPPTQATPAPGRTPAPALGEACLSALEYPQPYLDDGIDLFPSERGALVAERTLLRRFRRYCNDLELSAGLDLHSFRRSYITHLIEDGWDAKFVQDQAGHDYASTTSLYIGVSSGFRTRTLRRVLDQTIKDALTFGEETS